MCSQYNQLLSSQQLREEERREGEENLHTNSGARGDPKVNILLTDRVQTLSL